MLVWVGMVVIVVEAKPRVGFVVIFVVEVGAVIKVWLWCCLWL